MHLPPLKRHASPVPWVGGGLGWSRDLLRLSVVGYTTRNEIDRLLAALARELDAEHRQEDK